MCAVRRSHAGALLALAALVLLLARLPAPPRPARPRPRPLPLAPSTAAPAPAPAPAAVAVAVTNATAAPSAPVTIPAVAPPAPAPVPAVSAVLVRDIYTSGYSVPAPELCPSLGARLKLLILVTSAPSHASARDAVRLTWGHYAARSDVALGFVLGAAPPALQPALDAERDLYGDLIVGRFQDSYSNLTLKTLSMLEWADTFCPRAPRLLKTDDDMFVNVPRLLRFSAARGNASRTIWGRVMRRSLPKRSRKSKYYVPPEQFAGAVFPDFASGPAYLLTRDCVRPLRAAAAGAAYLRLEDVFVTGVLAARAGLARQHAPEFYNRKISGHPCSVQRSVAVHMVRWHEQFDFWRKLLDNRTKCNAS